MPVRLGQPRVARDKWNVELLGERDVRPVIRGYGVPERPDPSDERPVRHADDRCLGKSGDCQLCVRGRQLS